MNGMYYGNYGFYGIYCPIWNYYRVGEMARQGAMGVEDIIRNKVSKIRHWKLNSLGKKRPKWGFEFTVMTYNILSQAAVDCHYYLYTKCNPHFLTEEYRLSRILPEILKSKSDVVCLQEVEQHVYDQRIKNVFDSNGFGSIFKKKTGNKSDGCAILWRKAKFNLLNHHEVEFKAKGCEYLNRDNVGLIAVLKPRHPQANQTQLHVATTHLIFNPRRGDVKLCQLRLLLAELERSAFKRTSENGRVYHPTILCGDFNFEPHSPLYKFIDTGRIEVTGLVSGNMSGQRDGKDKGGKLFAARMSLDILGVDESGHFKQDAEDRSAPKEVLEQTGALDVNKSSDGSSVPKKALQMDRYFNQDRPSVGHCASKEVFPKENDSVLNISPDGGGTSRIPADRGAEASNGSRLNSYRFLKEMAAAAHLQSMTGSVSDDPTLSHRQSNIGFQRDGSPSSSSSNSESDAVFFYHDFNFVPTYKYYHRDKTHYPVTSMTGRDTNTVDHIFYNVKQKNSYSYVEDCLKHLGTYTLPHADDLKEIDGLPNSHLGSDHLSLMSKFIISFRH